MPPKRNKSHQTQEQEVDASDNLELRFKVPHKNLKEDDICTKIQQTQARVKEKEEALRKLKLVKMYRTKWETQSLEAVTSQWLRVCQEALEDLRVKAREIKSRETGEEELTLLVLINNLGIDPQLLKLDENEDCFNA
ncbi:swi5-dependent recombination DNA repair protein 1 homolog [Procambarus clarkii]|uniref:swi5-dependent recombination DNA repair protein 1 homolog n=1 Tax=Procambarus clarkii TaxID=6728 RepID=UPI001E676A7B|nr:swi5-dependent recombination DNA repair protein 1 homolog [Procambarus clarkii]XP_045600939.1 swi5-dependent recombination DNA repair protein 1 homolog [Procambarus clarkii]